MKLVSFYDLITFITALKKCFYVFQQIKEQYKNVRDIFLKMYVSMTETDGKVI